MKNLITYLSKKSLSLGNGSGMTRKWFGNDSGMTRFSLASLICLCMLTVGIGNAWGAVTTYTFTSKAFADATNSWTSNTDGDRLTSGQGVQCTTSKKGKATTKTSRSNVKQVTVIYCTNASSGAGTIKVKIGSNSEQSYTITKSGGTSLRTATFTYATPQSGTISVQGNTTTNSMYIYGVSIITDSGSETCEAIDVTGGDPVVLPGGSTTYVTSAWKNNGSPTAYPYTPVENSIGTDDNCVIFTEAGDFNNDNGMQFKEKEGVVLIRRIVSTAGVDISIVCSGTNGFTIELTGATTKNSQTGTVSIDTESTDATLVIKKINTSVGYLKTISITPKVSCTAPNHVDITGTNKYLGGQEVNLTATAYSSAGTGSPIAAGDITGYQWQKKISGTWTNLSNGTTAGVTISGATTNNLTISPCTHENSGGYRCIVSTGATCSTKSHADGTDGYGVHVFSIYGAYYGGAYSHNEIAWSSSGTTGTATIHLNASSTYMFKVHSNNGYYYGNGTNNYIIQPVNWDCGTGNSEMRLFTGPEGDYTFTVDIQHGLDGSPYVIVQVDYPSVSHPSTGYVYITKWWDCYPHMWDGSSNALTPDGYDPQLTTYTSICGTDYWYFPVMDNYVNFAAKDNATWASADNNTGTQTVTSNGGKYLTHDGSWGWHDFTTYEISFDGNGNNGGSMSTMTGICPSANTEITSNAFTKTGYTFGGWKANHDVKNSSGSTISAGTVIADGTTIQITQDITLTAQWTAKTTTISFNQTSGTGGQTGTLTATYGSAMPSAPVTCPTRTGYDFGGYYDGSGGTGTQYYTNIGASARNWDKEDASYTLHAKWTIHTLRVDVSSVANATITATPAGGSAIAEGSYNASVDYGKTITLGFTADTHYSSITWDVYKTGTPATKVTVSGSGNGATFTMPDYAVTVSATAVEDAYKTVVFMNSGVEKQSGKVYVGERPSAPTLTDGTAHDACDATSDKHYGWTQDTWSGTIATQASMDEDYTVYVKGSNLPIVAAGDAATITYNAVWAKAEAGSETESITAFEDGDYFIVDTRAEVADHFFALNGGVTSNAIAVTDISSAVTENALEGTITLDLTDDVLVDAMKYRLTTVGDSITIKHISTDTKVSQMLTDTKFETTGNRNWTIEKHATDNRFTIQSWFTKSGTKTSCLLMQYSSWNSGAQQQDLTLTAKPYNSANMGGTAAKGQNYMSGYVYLVPAGGTSYSTFLISCCDKNVTLATNSPSHGSITFSPDGTIATCGADAATRQATMTVTPDAGYYLSAWSTTGVTPYSVSPSISYGSVSNSGAQATTVTFTQNTTTGTYTANATFTAIPVSSLSLRAQQTGQSDKVGNDLTMNCYPKEGQSGGNDPLNHTLKVLFEEVLPANALDKTYDWSVHVKATGDADWTAVGFTGNALNTNSIIHTYNKSTGTLIIKATEGTAEIKITAHDGSGVNAKVTITVANVAMSSVSVSPTEMDVYAGQKKPVTVTFTPANATDRSYSAGSSYTYVNIQNKGASSFNIEGKTSVTDANHDETVTVTTTDGSKTATVDVTVKPLPKVMFVDNVHNESFANVIATVDEGGLTVTTTKSTPTHSDVSDPGASYNTCERQHLHLLGWIESTWADAHPNAEPGDITGAGAGNYYAAGADIDLVTQNNKTFYAVWTKIE